MSCLCIEAIELLIGIDAVEKLGGGVVVDWNVIEVGTTLAVDETFSA